MIEESLHAIQQRMANAMARVGRVDTALLVAVTKNHPVSAVEEVARLGVTHVGENRVQEAKEKQLTYKGPQLTWHLIGHLQVNKVRQAVPMFDLIHSVDSRKLLDEIEKVAAKHDKIQDVLLQVNVAREASKTGMTVEEFPEIRDYAPVGVFALIAVTVANFGFSSLWPLAKLVLLVHFAILFFALVVLGIVARLCGLSVWILIRILKDELILAYSTASSESVLPRIIEKMEAYGAPASITSFVVPTGYSFNLDGSTLYQSIAAIFIAQLYGIDLSIWQEIILVLTLMVTSKGIAGVPGVSFVVLLATLGSVGIPLEGLAFIAGVDRILDMARTALNVVGNALAVLVIAKWEHKFDRKKALAYEREVLGKFDKTADQ